MFAVVYGSEYDDVMFFSNMSKALKKLVIQSLNRATFTPFLQEYCDNGEGIFVKTKAIAVVDNEKLNKVIQEHGYLIVKNNPNLAIDTINITI